MNYMQDKFNNFVGVFLKILFFLIMVGSIAMPFLSFFKLSFKNIVYSIVIILVILLACLFLGHFIYSLVKKDFSNRLILLIILLLAFLLRLSYILLIDTKPFSDFAVIYASSQKFALGDYSVFKGVSYIARFPHLTILSIYLGELIKIFHKPIFAIKFINIILSTINVYIIYLISFELYEDKVKSIMISFVACIFPAFIFYNSVLCSENLAMPFFLGSVYLFILVIKNKKNLLWIFISGILLSIGNLFRIVGIIILIAYILHLLIYYRNKKSILISGILIVSFILPLISVNSLLLHNNVTEYSLWNGREPFETSILKGTNINSLGMWNIDDAQLSEKYNFNYNQVKSASIHIITERLTKTPLYKLIGFYLIKFIAQWSSGDFSGAYWSTGDLSILNPNFSISIILFVYSQLLYIILIISIYKNLFVKKIDSYDNKQIHLIHIIFCGFVMFYLIIEQQPRYAYIVSWIFILLFYEIPFNKLYRNSKKNNK
ncbi:glycosyltransferase family 39 protein [Clostridium pasteurianum]|uniref:Glycosyltransferase RgtA/B/C/D-like domain-containing protein n=1 Tax=Clostridium pasteurianum BC1 TaxID=86416 RepID=R4KJ00_CLOPA|nr:glycosyltransferase family 39 protein [Clostridium pasteurianum]AGK99605.1 hypothetical protein Clopa_4936 [Clostridium pasteurianum BC1]